MAVPVSLQLRAYRVGLLVYVVAIYIASIWKQKARLWVKGRKNTWQHFNLIPASKQRIWVHCASLGEYEQARPLIDLMGQQWPEHVICISFFSPSGFEQVKKSGRHTYICYLPIDSKKNARKFIAALRPQFAVFIKYEHWYYYLSELKSRGIPVFSAAAIFRKEQYFFKPYATAFRAMLENYTGIFLQDNASESLLLDYGFSNTQVTGDTRFDRVWQVYSQSGAIEGIDTFCGNYQVLVAGSTWLADEAIINAFIQEHFKDFPNLKIIIVPHEVSKKSIVRLQTRLQVASVLYSNGMQNISTSNARILIIDTLGLLSRIYQYASIAYIGGGFGAGIHNTLEAAVYGVPVLFGPKHHRFNEAKGLINAGAAFPISDQPSFNNWLNVLLKDEKKRVVAGMAGHQYVMANRGASARIVEAISNSIAKLPFQ